MGTELLGAGLLAILGLALGVVAQAPTPGPVFVFEAPLYGPIGATTFGYGGQTLATADLNNDGWLDIVVGSGLWRCNILLNQGNGRFHESQNFGGNSWETGTITGVACFDVDTDGDLDLVLSFHEPFYNPPPQRPNKLLLNDGTGRFTEDTSGRLPSSCRNSLSVAAADVDGDGDMDLVFGTSIIEQGGQILLFLNDGRGFYTDATLTHMPGTGVHAVHITPADIDRDGHVDLVIAAGGLAAVEPDLILRNNGTGHFSVVLLPGRPMPTTSIAVADLDGDGHLDLVLGFYSYLNDSMFRGDGQFGFTDMSNQLPQLPLDATYSVTATDLDGDGDLDLVLATQSNSSHVSTDYTARFYMNDGAGRFTDISGTFPVGVRPPIAMQAAAADLDNDGDQDLIMIGTYRGVPLSPFRLFIASNLQRHLYTQEVVYPGFPFHMLLFADQNSLVFPLLSTIPSQIPIPGLGLLGLDPSAAVPLPTMVSPASRTSVLGFRLPQDPTLTGTTIWSQALVVDQTAPQRARLTNRMGDLIR